MHNPEQQRISDLVSVAMNSVSNTGSALKIIGDLQAKNDSLAYQNMALAIALNNVRCKIREIADEMEREYPEEKIIPVKIRNISQSRDAKTSQSTINNIHACIASMRIIASGVQISPASMESWYIFLQSLRNLGLNDEIKSPLYSNANGSNPVPSHGNA